MPLAQTLGLPSYPCEGDLQSDKSSNTEVCVTTLFRIHIPSLVQSPMANTSRACRVHVRQQLGLRQDLRLVFCPKLVMETFIPSRKIKGVAGPGQACALQMVDLELA